MPSTLVPQVLLSDTSFDDTPQFTPADTPVPEPRDLADTYAMAELKEDAASDVKADQVAEVKDAEKETKTSDNDAVQSAPSKVKRGPKCKHGKKGTKDKKSKKKGKRDDDDSSSDSDSDDADDSDSESDSDADESDEESSEEDTRKRKPKRSKKSRKAKKGKKSKKSRKRDESSEDEDSDSESDESESEPDRRSKKSKKRSRRRRRDESESAQEEVSTEDAVEKAREYLEGLGVDPKNLTIDIGRDDAASGSDGEKRSRGKRSKKGKKRDPRKPAFFRGDELWNKEEYQHELKPTKSRAKANKDEDYVFTVKRHFDWDGKYEYTDVHIHATFLRESLAKIMENCKSVSLAEEEPVLEPDMLFLYLEDMRKYRKDLKNLISAQKLKKKTKKALEIRCAQLKVMIKYLDKDYAATKATLYPMLEQGTITFDLLWTLFRSEALVYTTTYGNESEPRAYKVDYCNKESSFTKGVWYEVIGKYFDFDGKDFGLGTFQTDIESFRGVRKISSLPVYPIQYHPKYDTVRECLIERGKKFVSLAGMEYKFLKGMAFMKRRGQIVKINVNGRIMCDPATFRRINPNYPISNVKREDPDLLSDCESDCGSQDEEEKEACNCPDCLANDPNAFAQRNEGDDEPKKRWKRIRDPKCPKRWDYVKVSVDDNGVEIRNMNAPTGSANRELESLKSGKADAEDDDDSAPGNQDTFSDEELLIASPVILGFAFSEKMWLELSVSGIQEISWNEGAFDSLVLPDAQKDIIKALVTAHSKEARAENKIEAKGEVEGKVAGPQQNIDDVIQGKGKGLVSVLHGTPGTGKTLTAEGIAELLKCPLYCVSAGELGTNPRDLEAELTKILDVAHAWGAVLLLDEADVFLEARTAQDIHRNALVSIFLRLLEYFQGILFLTTNRVASFDEAFQSRIHIALRYQELDYKARRKVWEMFLGRVRALPDARVDEFAREDFDRLARKNNLNGRQIKNAVRSAQALALHERVNLSMKHIEKVLQVAESFERDLKGGSGYQDAMRSYT